MLWVLVYRFEDGPKNGQKLVTLEHNCVIYDCILLNTFIKLSSAGLCQLKITKPIFEKLKVDGICTSTITFTKI